MIKNYKIMFKMNKNIWNEERFFKKMVVFDYKK